MYLYIYIYKAISQWLIKQIHITQPRERVNLPVPAQGPASPRGSHPRNYLRAAKQDTRTIPPARSWCGGDTSLGGVPRPRSQRGSSLLPSCFSLPSASLYIHFLVLHSRAVFPSLLVLNLPFFPLLTQAHVSVLGAPALPIFHLLSVCQHDNACKPE